MFSNAFRNKSWIEANGLRLENSDIVIQTGDPEIIFKRLKQLSKTLCEIVFILIQMLIHLPDCWSDNLPLI